MKNENVFWVKSLILFCISKDASFQFLNLEENERRKTPQEWKIKTPTTKNPEYEWYKITWISWNQFILSAKCSKQNCIFPKQIVLVFVNANVKYWNLAFSELDFFNIKMKYWLQLWLGKKLPLRFSFLSSEKKYDWKLWKKN